MQHSLTGLRLGGATSINLQLAQVDQQRAGDITAQAQQLSGVHLIVMAETVRCAQQCALDLLVQVFQLSWADSIQC